MADFLGDLEDVYAQAAARLVQVRAAWETLGSPLLSEGSTGQLVEHPLVKMLREGELECARLLGQLATRRGQHGPAPVAVVASRVGASPRAKLRVAK